MSIKDEISKNTLLRMLLIGIIIGLLCVSSFIIGALYSCNGSESGLDGLKCVNTHTTEVCSFGGRKYVINNMTEIFNLSIK